MLNAFLAIVIAVQISAPQQRADTRTWYQAYTEALQKIQQRNWQGAIADIEAASRLGAPKPGKNVLFYGDVYRDFNPDYYLGVAYLNLNRLDEADRAFERVKQAQLIVARDSLYAQFTKETAAVKDMLAKNAARERAAPNAASNLAVQTTQPTPSPASPPSVAASAPAPATDQAYEAAPPPSNQQPAQQTAVQTAPIQQTPAPRLPAANAPPRPANTQARPNPPAVAKAPVSNAPAPKAGPVPINASEQERLALMDFFTGQYAAAANKLNALTAANYTSPRIHFYLACSRVALALIGQPDDDNVIAEARAELALAGDTAQFAVDKQLISPRIKQALGIQP